MEITYNNNSLNDKNINKIVLKNIDKQSRKIFKVISWNNKFYFVKIVNRSIFPVTIKKDPNPTSIIIKFLNSNNKYIQFFSQVNVIGNMDIYDLYILDYIKYGDLCNILPILNSAWKFTLLMQCLVGVYTLNHHIKLFHNDLCYGNIIRNVMLDEAKDSNYIEVRLENTIIKLKIEKFSIKLIDFDRCEKEPTFRTKENHIKYFKDIKYVSEVLVFALFYFKTCHIDEYHLLLNMAKELEKSCKSLYEFDSKFIVKIYTKFRKYIL